MNKKIFYVKCPCCGTMHDLNFNLYMKLEKIFLKGKRSYFCNQKCLETYKKQHEVKYKDATIYQLDNVFVPYIECNYYFTTKEDCFKRVKSNVSVIDMNILGGMR